jgi:hypothetical protein
MNKKSALSFVILLLACSILANAMQYATYADSRALYSVSPLQINVVSDKTVYLVGENVQIYGNLTFYGQLLPNRLVALEIDDSANEPFIFRTLSTGTNANNSGKVEIIRVFPGDDVGNQLYSFKRGSNVYIWTVYQNNYSDPVYTTFAFTIYDANNAPMFAAYPNKFWVPRGGPYNMSYRWTLPSDAQLGDATIYASAFTELPKNKGVPQCLEKSETFTVTAATAATSTTTFASQSFYQISSTGNYNYSFTLPTRGLRLGNYTVSVAANYIGLWEFFPAGNTTRFKVRLLGDVNGDAKVDIKDMVLLIKAFGSYPGQPNWNPNADLNNDGKVDIKDMVLLIKHFGEHI